MEKEENHSNGEKKPVWNKSSSNGDSMIRPVIGAAAWPGLSETTKKGSLLNKYSKSLGDDGASSSSDPIYQNNEILPGLANGKVAPPSGQSSSGYLESPSQNQRNEFASQSHDSARNEYQRNSLNNQNSNHYPHQSHGGGQNWYRNKINSNGRHGFAQPSRGTPGFIPPPPPPLFYYIPPHQPFHPFTGRPMVFPEWAPSMMYQPHYIPPFVESYPHGVPIQDLSLESRIRNQVNYYFSEENLRNDAYLCKRMNDEGFVHIQVIAGFKKLKALTDNIQLILNALQRSDVVEVMGYEIRNRYNWREFVKRPHGLAKSKHVA